MHTPPKHVERSLKEGLELGEIDDEVFKIKNSKQGLGHFGLMTDGKISRKDAYTYGVISALARFIHPELF
jgi:non-canonical (house-cleaning) NTP pyrophosphatase